MRFVEVYDALRAAEEQDVITDEDLREISEISELANLVAELSEPDPISYTVAY